MSESKSESRVLDVFGPNLVIETNGPVGVAGPVAYQLYSVTDKGMKYQQALHGSGLATIEADGTLEIQTGFKNKDSQISYVAMAHHGDMCMTAEKGWIRIYGKNIVLEAANELVLQGAKVKIGNEANQTSILGERIEIGSKETSTVVVVGSKRITRQSNNIFLKSRLGNLPVIAGVAQAAFLGGNKKALTFSGEYRGGISNLPGALSKAPKLPSVPNLPNLK
tara:strand:- start:2034 stop:2699 length:666 start_codon:yes stop_codon:yes gene_type:complete